MNERDYFYALAAECNNDCENCIVPLEICKDVKDFDNEVCEL